MDYLVRWIALLVGLLLWSGALSGPGETGIVLLHGKQGTPESVFRALGAVLKDGGYLVSAPNATWSQTRIYDGPVEKGLLEIDAEVNRLREQGAKKIIIAGQSLGANVAIRYAATRSVDGIIALAPGHNPDSPAAHKLFAPDLERAHQFMQAGKGDQTERFTDANTCPAGICTYPVILTPRQYISWWGDEDGTLVMPRNAAAIKSPIPILFVVGDRDPLTRPKGDIFDKAPYHPLSKYAVVSGGHIDVPTAARSEVLAWLAKVSAQ
jgi:pimeloyl-ACP methyl ester carboxylesterase